jgi:hypothetical protein
LAVRIRPVSRAEFWQFEFNWARRIRYCFQPSSQCFSKLGSANPYSSLTNARVNFLQFLFIFLRINIFWQYYVLGIISFGPPVSGIVCFCAYCNSLVNMGYVPPAMNSQEQIPRSPQKILFRDLHSGLGICYTQI